MLLTLSAGSLRPMIKSNGAAVPDRVNSRLGVATSFTMLDVPGFAIKQLRLHGLNIPASMLCGWSLEDLDKLRDRADKAACPCLVLFEDTALPLASLDDAKRRAAAQRVQRLAVAANRLGCNAVALKCDGPDTPEAFDLAADEIRSLMPSVERLELNVLLSPHAGLTETTEKLTALIKRVGGFRIGSLPSFAAAAAVGGGDPIEGLRKLAPYAGAIHASVEGFNRKGAHKTYDLAACVSAIRSVGFLNTLAIDYAGAENPVPIIERARDVLQAAIDADAS